MIIFLQSGFLAQVSSCVAVCSCSSAVSRFLSIMGCSIFLSRGVPMFENFLEFLLVLLRVVLFRILLVLVGLCSSFFLVKYSYKYSFYILLLYGMGGVAVVSLHGISCFLDVFYSVDESLSLVIITYDISDVEFLVVVGLFYSYAVFV